MELTNSLIEEVVIAAREVDYGNVIISISGPPRKKIVDIITEKRIRYRECVSQEGSNFKKENTNST